VRQHSRARTSSQGTKRLNIVLIGNYEPDGQFSMLRYAEMLERLMRGAGHEAARVFPPVVFGRMRFLRGGAAKWARYADKYALGLPWLRWKCRRAEVVHVCDHSNSMYLWCAGRRPRLITCHDLLAVRSARGHVAGVKTGASGRMLQRWILRGLRRAEYIVCDSMSTEADVRELGGQRAVVNVVYLALNRKYFPEGKDAVGQALARFGVAADSRYLLHIGANVWYKNRLGAMQIFSRLKKMREFAAMKLLMAGSPWTEEMREFRRAEGLEDAIIETGIVTDDELRCLYSGAAALLFPSLQEGFGWPILEAQACGCPVITTNRGPMTEVAGEAAILLDDPRDAEQAARAIAEGWPKLAMLREAGFRNLDRFSEAKLAAAMSAAYQEVVERWGDTRSRSWSRAAD